MVNDTTNAFQISLDKMSHVELQQILAQLGSNYIFAPFSYCV